MVAPGKQARRPFGAVVAFALLLAMVPSCSSSSSSSAVEASATTTARSSSCVRITSAARSSSCVSGANMESFAFAMEGTPGDGAESARHHALEKEGGASGAESSTSIAARAGESTVPCLATDVAVTVGFSAPVVSVTYAGDSTVSGSSMVTFFAETLETNSTRFSVMLDTTGVAADSSAVTYASYLDNEGNLPDMSGLMTVASAAPGCDRYPATEARRKLHRESEDDLHDDCELCAGLSSAQVEALDMYDNGGKKIVCDPTCLDHVSDPTHCNYFGLGQICRGCGDCSTCTPCPDTGETPAPIPNLTEPPVSVGTPVVIPSPTPAPVVSGTRSPSTRVIDEDDDDGDAIEFDCTPCTGLSDDQLEALIMYDGGGKRIVCDPTCLDGVSDPIHCNYFGLGQICRGCGTCSTCTVCP